MSPHPRNCRIWAQIGHSSKVRGIPKTILPVDFHSAAFAILTTLFQSLHFPMANLTLLLVVFVTIAAVAVAQPSSESRYCRDVFQRGGCAACEVRTNQQKKKIKTWWSSVVGVVFNPSHDALLSICIQLTNRLLPSASHALT